MPSISMFASVGVAVVGPVIEAAEPGGLYSSVQRYAVMVPPSGSLLAEPSRAALNGTAE